MHHAAGLPNVSLPDLPVHPAGPLSKTGSPAKTSTVSTPGNPYCDRRADRPCGKNLVLQHGLAVYHVIPHTVSGIRPRTVPDSDQLVLCLSSPISQPCGAYHGCDSINAAAPARAWIQKSGYLGERGRCKPLQTGAEILPVRRQTHSYVYGASSC